MHLIRLLLTNLLVAETKPFKGCGSITDKSNTQHVPGWRKWWWLIRCSVECYIRRLEVICIINQQEVFTTLSLEFGKIQSYLFVDRYLYLPSAIFFVVIVGRVISWRHYPIRSIEERSAACNWKIEGNYLCEVCSRLSHKWFLLSFTYNFVRGNKGLCPIIFLFWFTIQNKF